MHEVTWIQGLTPYFVLVCGKCLIPAIALAASAFVVLNYLRSDRFKQFNMTFFSIMCKGPNV